MKLPKNYLSYSAVRAFNATSTRRQWIQRYIFKEPFFTSKEMIFWRRVSDALEEENFFKIDTDIMEVVGRAKVKDPAEVCLVLQQRGFYIIGYLDACSEDYTHVTEYKTGKAEWNQERVDNHLQLDTYSLMIYDAFGIIPTNELIWMETRDANVKGGVEFTGRIERFKRTVTKQEIEDCRKMYNDAAVEMQEIYKCHLEGFCFQDAKKAREKIKEIQNYL